MRLCGRERMCATLAAHVLKMVLQLECTFLMYMTVIADIMQIRGKKLFTIPQSPKNVTS